MPPLSPATVKLRSQLRLLIPRLRNAQKKDTALSVAARREMADLLAANREQSARIRVENIIHTDVTVELMEILELYAELLLARAGMLDLRDKIAKEGLGGGAGAGKDLGDDEGAGAGGGGGGMTGLEEAAASLVYAAPRLPREVKELAIVRALLVERFGKEWALKVGENEGGEIVPRRVAEKLTMEVPRPSLVQAYLEEIARSYGVEWPLRNDALEGARDEVQDEQDEDDDDDDGGAKEQPILADQPAGQPQQRDSQPAPKTPAGKAPGRVDISGLNSATPPSGNVAKSPISVAPPGARSDNLNPRVKLPGGGAAGGGGAGGGGGGGGGPKKAAAGGGPGGSVPTVDDLAKRFSALKR